MKPALIIGSVLVVVGLIMSFVCFAIIGFDFKELNMLKPITNTYTVEEKFSSIEISSVEATLHILPAEDDVCRVVCNEDDNMPHTVTVENGVLKIQRINKLPFLKRLFYLSWGKFDITLYLPESEYTSLSAKTVSGNVTVDAGLIFSDEVSLNTTSGNVSAFLLSCDEFYVKTTSGNITVSVLKSTSFESETTSGESCFSSVTCTGEFEAQSTSGNIRVDRCDAANFDLKAISGNVTGIILSQKSFSAKTTSGKVSVPENGGTGQCHVQTTSGNISFSVE